MERKMLTLLAVPILAIALAASAVAFVPGILNAFSAGPAATSVAAPTWKVGDTWTYNVSLASTDAGEVLPGEMSLEPSMPTSALVVGTVTETVVGSVTTDAGPAWNATVDTTLHFGEPTADNGTEMATLSMPFVTVSGFAWYRQSDLAPVYSLKTVTLSHTWTIWGNTSWFGTWANGTYTTTYRATTQVWYHPALSVWSFPLQENASWNVTSNASVRYDSSFEFTGPNLTYDSNHSANFTLPIGFTVRTGGFDNITTPAGTFRALSVSTYRREAPEVADRDASAMMNLTESTDVEMPHALVSAWFSGQAGNVVKADLGFGGLEGPRVELDLVSYTYS